MAGKRVAFLTAEGDFGTVDESEAKQLPAGSRVLSAKETAQRAVDERYDKLSPTQKVIGVASTAIGAALGNPLLVGTDPNAPPTAAAYGAGARQGMTAGLFDAGVRKASEAVGGKVAGDRYAEQRELETTTSPTATAAGELAGMVGGSLLSGGSAGAARALPAAGITALGEGVEQAVGRGLAGLAERGAVGRAAATAAEMGARGAFEGGAYAAAQEMGDALLKDQELSADKIFAATGSGILMGGLGGAALGGAGSLLRSGGRAAARGLGDLAVDGSGLRGAIQDKAYDEAWKSVGAGHGLQTTSFAKRAEKYLPNGTRDIGEWMMRKGIHDAEGGLVDAMKNGTPAELVPRIEAAVEADGARLGQLTEASGARVPMADIEGVVQRVRDGFTDPTGKVRYQGYSKYAGQEHVVAELDGYLNSLKSKLGASDTVSVQDLLTQRKGLDRLVYQETKSLDPKMRVQALRDVRSELEGLVVDALDGASGQMRGELATEYKALKKDYFAGSVALEAAEDSAARASKHATFGLLDTLRSGAGAHVGAMAGGAIGGPIGAAVGGAAGGAVGALASKMIRERGNAAAAVALHKLSTFEVLTKLAAKTDAQITAASRGLLTAPPKVKIEQPNGTPRVRAQQVAKLIASLQADPDGTTNHVTKQTEGIAASAPDLAQALTQRHVMALTFLASKMPTAPDRDPMDPHPAPRMTDTDAATFARYAWYAERPSRFFTEMAAGKITPEGAETAQTLMPRAFADLQRQTLEAIANHMARGRTIPFQQRLRIGTMLDIPAVTAQDPQHAMLLQQNVLGSDKQSKPAPAKARAHSAINQRSALDVLEAHGPGRR